MRGGLGPSPTRTEISSPDSGSGTESPAGGPAVTHYRPRNAGSLGCAPPPLRRRAPPLRQRAPPPPPPPPRRAAPCRPTQPAAAPSCGAAASRAPPTRSWRRSTTRSRLTGACGGRTLRAPWRTRARWAARASSAPLRWQPSSPAWARCAQPREGEGGWGRGGGRLRDGSSLDVRGWWHAPSGGPGAGGGTPAAGRALVAARQRPGAGGGTPAAGAGGGTPEAGLHSCSSRMVAVGAVIATLLPIPPGSRSPSWLPAKPP